MAWQNPYANGQGPLAVALNNSTGSPYNSSYDVLNGPVNLNNEYQFGDWISGRSAAKQQTANQAAMDYAEWVRNEYSASQQRQFETWLDSTRVQRSMADLKAAGLNPWLAVQSAGFGGSVPSGVAATSSAGQVAGSSSSPGTAIGATAVGIAALVKLVAKFLK